MLSGEVLSRWLQQQAGTVVQGSRISIGTSGLLRVSSAPDSVPVQVSLPVMHGGQAAVARARDAAGVEMALRVQAVISEHDRARQMERLTSMVTVATAARERPDLYPAILPVRESFVITVPGAQMPMVGAAPEYELWCDLMAWCPGDLNDWERTTGPRGLENVLALFVPVMVTVQAVHENLGIVHRDITPNNVLVDASGRLLLADWGIAHGIAADQTSTYTQLIGNQGFALPPEMLMGDPSVGRYTDAWYLGCLLAWMLTGDTPGAQHGSRWLPPGLPTGGLGDVVRVVLTGLCAPDPRERLDLRSALTALYEGRAPAVTVTRPGSVSPWGIATPMPGADRRDKTNTRTSPSDPGRKGAYSWAVLVVSVIMSLAVFAFAGWLVYLASQDDEPGRRTSSKWYVVWDGGTDPFTWEGQSLPPVYIFASEEHLPRQITCDGWEKPRDASFTENPHGKIDLDPLVLTADVDVEVTVGSGCSKLDITLSPEANWTITWNGVDEYGASPKMTIAQEGDTDTIDWTVGQETFENIPDPGQPTLHLTIEARGAVSVDASYLKWKDGSGAFPIWGHYKFARFWFPSTDELPRQIKCTTADFSGLDFRQLTLDADTDVDMVYGSRCPRNTILLSPDQNWTLEWTGTGSATLEVADGVGAPSGQTLEKGTTTLTNVVDPGRPTLHLVVTSETAVHVEPLRAVY
ncbi:MAG: protein kinase [Micrococcales bacterium]|nr:protein kinase [Micrococcales bacterium]